MLNDFEAYLLTKMRAVTKVHDVLMTTGMVREELEEKGHQAVARWGFDRVGHNAEVYNKAIGDPVIEYPLPLETTPALFHGSIRRLYQLALWPRVLFCVNQHPSGYAWGEEFVQKEPVPTLPESSAIKPWDWVATTIERFSSHLEVVDHWDSQKDIRLVLPQGAENLVILAKFDFNLLQDWQHLSRTTHSLPMQ